jgi:hypothetical protein
MSNTTRREVIAGAAAAVASAALPAHNSNAGLALVAAAPIAPDPEYLGVYATWS